MAKLALDTSRDGRDDRHRAHGRARSRRRRRARAGARRRRERAPSCSTCAGCEFMDSSGLRAIVVAALGGGARGRPARARARARAGDARVRHHPDARAAHVRGPRRRRDGVRYRVELAPRPGLARRGAPGAGRPGRPPPAAAAAGRAAARLRAGDQRDPPRRPRRRGHDHAVGRGERPRAADRGQRPRPGLRARRARSGPRPPVRLGALPRARAVGPLGRRAQRADARLVRARPRAPD